MIPEFSKIHNRFKLNGTHFNHEELKEVAYSYIKEGEPFEKAIGNFLIDWLNNKEYLYVKTSGSTGVPKEIKIMKQAMVNSAIATGDYFKLQPGDTALHCLPSQYIAGKMMLVRAMILGLQIDSVAPSSHPIFNYDRHYDFVAVTPMQLNNIIVKTKNIKIIIVGGSKVTKPLLEKIRVSEALYFETYGMTETVTHVAVKQLKSMSGKTNKYYNALPNVRFNKDDRDCLVISAPEIVNVDIVTNDLIELISETQFKLLGRYDNVINSGGVKLFPEKIEEKLRDVINERFIVAGEHDEILGERLVLIVEKSNKSSDDILSTLKTIKTLNKFELPKAIYHIDKFKETDTGKIQRNQSLNFIIEN